jgi:hypothetical protein
MNKKPSDSKEERMVDLYGQLYPKIVEDFAHLLDLTETLNHLGAEIAEIKNRINMIASLGSGIFDISQLGSGLNIRISRLEATKLIVRKGETESGGTVAKEDRKMGTAPSSSEEGQNDLLDPENPIAN